MLGNKTGRSGQASRNRNGRRERATRGAFCLWIATYAAAVAAIVTVHALGGAPAAPDIDPSHHATRAGASPAPLVARADMNG